MDKQTEELRNKYIQNPPEDMTPEDVRNMSEDDLWDMDYFLHEDDVEGEETYVTANIEIDFKRVRKYDRIVKIRKRRRRRLIPAALLFLLGMAALFWYGRYILGGIAGILLLLAVFPIITNRRCSDEYLSRIYLANQLLPAIVRKTNPLTILAMEPRFTRDDGSIIYGCREFAVSELPGHTLRPGERIPCVSVDYGEYYEVHPLCCATGDMEKIRENEVLLKTAQWEALEHLAANLPDNDLELMHMLDENYNYLYSKKYYMESQQRDNEESVLAADIYAQYTKQYESTKSIEPSDPHFKVHQRMLDLALEYQVYEYVFELNANDRPYYFTYACNPIEFMKKADSFAVPLAKDEIPLAAGHLLVTSKGIWVKGEFTPWVRVHIENRLLGDDTIQTRMNGKELACLSLSFDKYHLPKEQVKEQKKVLGKLERERLTRFWRAIAETGLSEE